jgi:hypothetical protein
MGNNNIVTIQFDVTVYFILPQRTQRFFVNFQIKIKCVFFKEPVQ